MNRISNFLAAAESGDTVKVAESLNQGIEVNVTDENGQTALMLAADEGHVDTVKLLLQRGASIDLQNKLGGTALMLASFNGHLEIMTELLEAGADVNAKSENGYTALMQAASRRNETGVQIISLLLDKKADINAQDKEGYTALMRAVALPTTTTAATPILQRNKRTEGERQAPTARGGDSSYDREGTCDEGRKPRFEGSTRDDSYRDRATESSYSDFRILEIKIVSEVLLLT